MRSKKKLYLIPASILILLFLLAIWMDIHDDKSKRLLFYGATRHCQLTHHALQDTVKNIEIHPKPGVLKKYSQLLAEANQWLEKSRYEQFCGQQDERKIIENTQKLAELNDKLYVICRHETTNIHRCLESPKGRLVKIIDK